MRSYYSSSQQFSLNGGYIMATADAVKKLGNWNDKISSTDVMISDKLIRMQLANARKQKHLTQKQLSAMSGLSESCISNIESGDNSSPTLRSLIRYATALGVTIDIDLKSRANGKDKEI